MNTVSLLQKYGNVRLQRQQLHRVEQHNKKRTT